MTCVHLKLFTRLLSQMFLLLPQPGSKFRQKLGDHTGGLVFTEIKEHLLNIKHYAGQLLYPPMSSFAYNSRPGLPWDSGWCRHYWTNRTVCLCVSPQDIQQVKTPEDLENFMLKHGENIIDTLGAEVDRLEKELKVLKHESVCSSSLVFG